MGGSAAWQVVEKPWVVMEKLWVVVEQCCYGGRGGVVGVVEEGLGSRGSTTYYLLLTAYYIRLTTYYLLLTTYHLLLTTYCSPLCRTSSTNNHHSSP